MTAGAVGIIGPGRAGLSFGHALAHAGHPVRVHGRRPRQLPVPLPYTHGDAPPVWLGDVAVLILAVPDGAITTLASDLARTGRLRAGQVVLHLSGVLTKTALDPLRASGAALGSLHPLMALADPALGPERLRGAMGAVEGDAEAVAAATALADSIGLRPIRVAGERKVLYHCAAVFASPYLVVTVTLAERLLVAAGFSAQEARDALAPIVTRTAANVARQGVEALTGPVTRGDSETVRRHLTELPRELRAPYRALGLVALEMSALPDDRRRELERLLTG